MHAEMIPISEPAHSLSKSFMMNFPTDAARVIEAMSISEASQILQTYPATIKAPVIERITPGLAEHLLLALPEKQSIEVLSQIDTSVATSILSRLQEDKREHLLSMMAAVTEKELRSLLVYPDNTAGSIMRTKVIAFNENSKVYEAIELMKKMKLESVSHLYLLNSNMQLQAQVDIRRLALVDAYESLKAIAAPIKIIAQALDPKKELLEAFEKHHLQSIPVVDIEQRIIGVIENHELVNTLREDMAANMQTMVGVSKDEGALSSSFFAVKKRLPWLQINLLTAFLAAAVVGMFESTIAKYTALAILLPIAAGQSGNAGAQALAVTMRGLTLREISMKHWLRVLIKECGAGLMNGVGIAITCSIGVYLWSQSLGLALVMALSMIISMTIAGMAGAVVPILLKRFGLDPAQSSSIVLTTITDIAGFMSFLGIATLLAGMLTAG